MSERDEFGGGLVEVVGAAGPFLRVGCCAESLAGRGGGEFASRSSAGVQVAESSSSAGHCWEEHAVLEDSSMHWMEVMSTPPRGKTSADIRQQPRLDLVSTTPHQSIAG